MKYYISLVMAAFFALCASAQVAKAPTKQEFANQCNEVQNNINVLNGKLIEIKNAEQQKFTSLHKNANATKEQFATNDSLLEKASQIVSLAKEYYEEDSISNKARVALDVVANGLRNYWHAVFKDLNTSEIDVKENFEGVINDQLEQFNNTLRNFAPKEDADEQDPNVDDEREDDKGDSPSNVPVTLTLVGFVFVLCIIGIYSLILKSKCSENRHEIRKLRKDLEKEIKKNEETFYDLQSKIKNSRNSTDNYTSQKEFEEKIRRIVLNEIDKKFKEAGNNNAGYSTNNIPTGNPAPVNVAQKVESKQISPKNEKKETYYNLYGQLQNDGSFKVSQSDSRNAFYILKLKDSQADKAEFTLKELDNETTKALIEGRQMHLVPACDIELSANPQKIVVTTPGTVERQGNLWVVKNKAQIKLVNA